MALSEEGATIIACDVAEQIVAEQIVVVPCAMATETDLHETARLITEQGGRCTTERVEGGTVYTVGGGRSIVPVNKH